MYENLMYFFCNLKNFICDKPVKNTNNLNTKELVKATS